MRTIEYLSDPMLRQLYLPALVAGLAIVVMCGLLSVIVVVKRLAFVGQGVSHSAFGGIGVAAVAAAVWGRAVGPVAEFAIVVVFCAAAALGMAAASDRRRVQTDTAIGVFLVASMGLGAVLVEVARRIASSGAGSGGMPVRSWESILFGSIAVVGWADAATAVCVAGLVTAVLWAMRRPLVFWASDEGASPAFGVPTKVVRMVLMVLLAITVVTAMKLAGVVLATALLVLPGATALKVSDRLGAVVGWSCVFGAVGLLAGLVASFELDLPPGACIVLVMTVVFAAVWAWMGMRGRAA